jgi:hypothetical protein
MKITAEQELHILHYVENNGLLHTALRDDVVDHLCCVVESRIKKKHDFERLLAEAIEELAPHGLDQLQHQTLYLLNSNRIIMMKKIMYTFGLLGAMSLSAGTLLKIMHLPGANILFITGAVALFLIFIPLLTIDLYKVALAKALSERAKLFLGVSASVLVGLSVIFKILHLQGANIMLFLGAIIFTLGFLPFLFFNLYKKSVS